MIPGSRERRRGTGYRPACYAVLSLGALDQGIPRQPYLSMLTAMPVTAAAALLGRHKVVQLAAERLEVAGDWLAVLRDALVPMAVAARRRSAAVESLLPLLGKASTVLGVPIAPMKGAAARAWYSRPVLRDVSDLDVWVETVEDAYRLAWWLRQELGYAPAPFELPWLKRAEEGPLYGVLMLAAPSEELIPVDVHFGAYSVRHCGWFRPVVPPTDGCPARITVEDNLCSIIANAAGDYFVDVKTLNDVSLVLARDDVDWERVLAVLGTVRLVAFFATVLDRLLELENPGDQALKRIEELRRGRILSRRWREPPPKLTRRVWWRRCAITVAHAAAVGWRRSPWHAARLAVTAFQYYRRPLRLRLGQRWRPTSAFRVRLNAWTCTRLVPIPLVAALLDGRAASTNLSTASGSVPQNGNLTTIPIPTPEGDLVQLGGELFVPTIWYRLSPRHARAAIRSAQQSQLIRGGGEG